MTGINQRILGDSKNGQTQNVNSKGNRFSKQGRGGVGIGGPRSEPTDYDE